MTKHPQPVDSTAVACELAAGAPEMEITPAMIVAGVRVYARADHEFDPVERIILEIFQEMKKASLPTGATAPSPRSTSQCRPWWS